MERTRTGVVVMEEDVRKQGMLYVQQQRFGKVRLLTRTANANANTPGLSRSVRRQVEQ